MAVDEPKDRDKPVPPELKITEVHKEAPKKRHDELYTLEHSS